MPTKKTNISTERMPSPKSNISSKRSILKNYLNKRNVVIAIVVIFIVAIVYLLKNQLIVATVNGEPINRLTLINQLEKQTGKKVLEGLVTNTLILQEAKKRNVVVNNSEIDAEIKNIDDNLKKSGQSLDQALMLQGLTIDVVKEQVKVNLIIKKLLAGKISVSDKDINDYIDQNKESIPKDAKLEDTKKQARQQLEQQKLQGKYQELIKSLQDKAKINYLIKL